MVRNVHTTNVTLDDCFLESIQVLAPETTDYECLGQIPLRGAMV